MRLPIKVDEETGVPTALFLIISSRENGKSILAGALIDELGVPKDRVALVDPQGTLAVNSGIARFKVEPTEESSRAFLEKVLRPAEEAGHGYFLVIDEADRFMTTRSVVGGQQGPYFEFINVSRGWGMGGLLISHGAAVTSKNAMEQADFSFIGNTTETNALRYWRSYFGDPHYVELIRRLPKYHFLVWCRRTAPNWFQGVVTVEDGHITSVSESELRERMGDNPVPEDDDGDEEVTDAAGEDLPSDRPSVVDGP